MPYPINELAVVVAALLALAVGSVWYSPLVFGNYWLRATGLLVSDLPETKRELIRVLVGALVTNVCVLGVLAECIAIGERFGISPWYFSLLLLILVGACIMSMALWEKRSLLYVSIHIGYLSLILFGGTAVLFFWPW